MLARFVFGPILHAVSTALVIAAFVGFITVLNSRLLSHRANGLMGRRVFPIFEADDVAPQRADVDVEPARQLGAAQALVCLQQLEHREKARRGPAHESTIADDQDRNRPDSVVRSKAVIDGDTDACGSCRCEGSLSYCRDDAPVLAPDSIAGIHRFPTRRHRLVSVAYLADGRIASHRRRESGAVFPINGRLRDELLNETLFTSLAQARVILGCWRADYNDTRPHSQLGWRTPSEFAMILPPAPGSGAVLC